MVGDTDGRTSFRLYVEAFGLWQAEMANLTWRVCIPSNHNSIASVCSPKLCPKWATLQFLKVLPKCVKHADHDIAVCSVMLTCSCKEPTHCHQRAYNLPSCAYTLSYCPRRCFTVHLCWYRFWAPPLPQEPPSKPGFWMSAKTPALWMSL